MVMKIDGYYSEDGENSLGYKKNRRYYNIIIDS